MKSILFAALCASTIAGCVDYSDGDRSGTITKISRKGLFCKTWEGEMVLGGMTADVNGNATANIWRFTVEDSALIPLIQNAATSGKRVTLSYREELWTFCRSDSGNYFVKSLKGN